MEEEQKKFDFNGLIILEMANNHQGNVEHGKKIIEAFAPVLERAGAKGAIKFQFRDIGTFIHPDFRESSEYKHIPRFLSTALSKEQFKELIDAARDFGFIVMTTPTDESSVDLLEELGVDIIKIASCSAGDWPLLERVVKTGKPVVCSTAGLSLEEVDNLVSFFNHRGVDFALTHCVSLYPTPKHKLNLERINVLKNRYPNVTIGFSSHEHPDSADGIRIAYAKGARLFERHIGVETDEIKLNAYSLRPDQFEKWLDVYHDTIAMIGSEARSIHMKDEEEKEQIRIQKRGVYANRDIKTGEKISREDVFFAMPLQENQLESGKWREGFIADRDYNKNEFLPEKLLSPKITRKQIVYKAIHDARGILNTAKVFVNNDSSVTLFHPNGIRDFFETGLFVINCVNQKYCKKIIVILPGQNYPAFYHKKRDKTIQVLAGQFKIEIEGESRVFYPGDTTVIPSGVWHSFPVSKGAIIEEVSIQYPDDIDYFKDQEINKKSAEERETNLVHWGRHQFEKEP